MWEDPALDPVPPGHGERETEGHVPRSVPLRLRIARDPSHPEGEPCPECGRPFGGSHLGTCLGSLIQGGSGIVGYRHERPPKIPVAPLRMCPRCFYCHPLDQECER